jgi:hypothetical protein
MALEFTTSYLKDSIDLYRYYKKLAERAIEQVPDDKLFSAIDGESNSIAIIIKHITGNLRSRWTGFPEADGEKPDRNRDGEFESPAKSRAELVASWETSFKLLFEALARVTDADLGRTVRIRGEAHSIMQAVNRNLTHTAYHVGQIVFLAKHLASDNWQSLTIPRGKSSAFNADVAAGNKSQR